MSQRRDRGGERSARRKLTGWQVALIAFAVVLGMGAAGTMTAALMMRVREIAGPKPILNADLDEVIKDWHDHPVKAMERYGGKRVVVSGHVKDIDARWDGVEIAITSEEKAGWLAPKLEVHVPRNLESRLKSYSKGSRITLHVEFREMKTPPQPVAVAIEVPG